MLNFYIDLLPSFTKNNEMIVFYKRNININSSK